MENKYYTPELSEFYPGFEYYFMSAYQEGIDADSIEIDGIDGYRKCIYDLPNSRKFNTKDWLESAIENDQIKVKYLDEEDIEELGFVRVSKLDPNKYRKLYNNSEVNLLIAQKDGIIYEIAIQSQYANQEYFIGAIKNKSELKNILDKAGKIVKL